MSKELEALERLKTAPSFMGGTAEYQACTQSEALLMQDYEIVRQALLKAQEPKKYLKWEDLEFKDEEQTMKVILNGSVHFLSYYRNMFSDNLCMIDNTGITIWKENKQFFNDLHLERVEE